MDVTFSKYVYVFRADCIAIIFSYFTEEASVSAQHLVATLVGGYI